MCNLQLWECSFTHPWSCQNSLCYSAGISIYIYLALTDKKITTGGILFKVWRNGGKKRSCSLAAEPFKVRRLQMSWRGISLFNFFIEAVYKQSDHRTCWPSYSYPNTWNVWILNSVHDSYEPICHRWCRRYSINCYGKCNITSSVIVISELYKLTGSTSLQTHERAFWFFTKAQMNPWSALIACLQLSTVNRATVKAAGDWWHFIHLSFFFFFLDLFCSPATRSNFKAMTQPTLSWKLIWKSPECCYMLKWAYPAGVFKHGAFSLSCVSLRRKWKFCKWFCNIVSNVLVSN